MNLKLRQIHFILILCLTAASSSTARAHILPPPAYLKNHVQYTELLSSNTGSRTCSVPAPYIGKMEFRSRYEGSGKARDVINPQADQAYREATKSINELQKFVAQTTDRIIQKHARQDDVDCLIKTLVQWANQSTLLEKTDNLAGMAVRKWTLASLSSNLLKVWNILQEHGAPQDITRIRTWINTMADTVVSNYSNIPLKRINNHHYWAAWAVMTSAALLDRDDLYSWSKSMFATAMGQINSDGYLPNELRRNSRATLYHNYALAPLVGIAVFLDANGTNPFTFNDQALARLTAKVMESVDEKGQNLMQITGSEQKDTDLTVNGQLAWLAMYTTIADRGPTDVAEHCHHLITSGLTLRATRLGGDLEYLYLNHLQ